MNALTARRAAVWYSIRRNAPAVANVLAESPIGLPFAGLPLGMPDCTMRLARYVFRHCDAALAVSSVRLAPAAICKAHQVAGVWLYLSQPRSLTTPDGWRKCWPPSPPRLPLGLRNRSTLLPGVAAALRRSELMGLRTGDIARAHGRRLTVLVQRTKAEHNGRGPLLDIRANPAAPHLSAQRTRALAQRLRGCTRCK